MSEIDLETISKNDLATIIIKKDYLLKEQGKELKDLYKEIERLNSIIKGARELREQLSYQYYENGFEYDTPMLLKDLDKILDKENK